jgi:hypothetical protein
MKENKMCKLALFTGVMLSVSLFFTSSPARADFFTKPSSILDLGTTSISAGAEADVV